MKEYSRAQPFLASIKKRAPLCKEGSKKNTQEIVLDLTGFESSFQVGDSIGIAPTNDPELAEQVLRILRLSGEEIVVDRQSSESSKLRDYLLKKANIIDVSRKLLDEIIRKEVAAEKKKQLQMLMAEENKDALKQFLSDNHLLDVLKMHPEVAFEPQEFISLLMPLLPRLYSIASSPKAFQNEVHLSVAFVEYDLHGSRRRGVCTNYLCNLAPLKQRQVPVYIQPNHGFTVPKDKNASMIMVGPGTGVAPFRAFLQERIAEQATGKHWLFFGEWNRKTDFFYEEFFEELVSKNILRCDTAFSRDQEHKVYVQHKMLEHGKELFKWLEAGAYFYVCGDAKQMAKDVEAALLKIIQEGGGLDEKGAKEYLKKMRGEKRYLRDVY